MTASILKSGSSLGSLSIASTKGRANTFEKDHGLSWFVAAFFVVADLAGGGLVALPTAMIQSGFWVGLVLCVIMTGVVTYTAYLLGLSWNILLERWSEYHDHCRKPYPEMGYRALGIHMRRFVSVAIDVTQFGTAVVYLLLSSKNIHDFIKAFFGGNVSFCIVVLFVAAALLPITFLKSPQDFWAACVIAMLTTTAAVILIIIGSVTDMKECAPHRGMPDFHITNYFLALGTFLFSYGGHAAFPTIQHDMRRPTDFTKSVLISFAIVACMYTPVSVLGYVTYGNSLRDSIINSIQINWIQQAINILITLHCILTLTIVFNPINQEAEDIFNVPQQFGWKRAVVRSGIMVAVVFVAESIPTFGPLLDLMGGSTLSLTSIVFPCLFYLYLSAAKKKSEVELNGADGGPCSFRDVIKYTPKHTLIICCLVIAFGIIGGAAATFSAIKELATTSFTAPCYVQPFLSVLDDSVSSKSSADSAHHTNCCGMYQNISAHAGVGCNPADLNFYGDHN